MPRPSFTALIALSLLAAVGFTGCKTIYSDMYSPRRNYFKPDKETQKATELLPPPTSVDINAPLPNAAPPVPGLDPAMPGAPAPAPAPGAPPVIPGL